jgi:arachidonate 15-lipoxygenase
MSSGIQWTIRRSFWDVLTAVKYRAAKPARIPVPAPFNGPVESVPLRDVFPRIAIGAIPFAKNVPVDEASPRKRRAYDVQMWLARVFGPQQDGLPEVDPDPMTRLAQAYRAPKRALFPAPLMPPEFSGSEPDLGALALAGPYYGYLTPAGDDRWQWDLRVMGQFEHRPDVYKIGSRVVFERDDANGAFRPVLIECELGEITPSDPRWGTARAIALCALTTHCGLVRHFNGVHLTFGSALAITARNALPADHPLLRLLWPHFYGTQYSNEMATLSQLDPAGDFAQVYSYTLKGLYDTFEQTYPTLRLSDYDPVAYIESSGLRAAGIASKGAADFEAMYAIFEDHARTYLSIYYASDAALAADAAVARWLAAFDDAIPNGLPAWTKPLTIAALARLVAVLIHVVVVEHELRGSGLWNYQLWTHVHPIRVYRDGRREPLDLYQRLVNCNMTLNTKRAMLLQDFSHLALDERGAGAFRAFQRRLEALGRSFDDDPRQTWRLYPDTLTANMNA